MRCSARALHNPSMPALSTTQRMFPFFALRSPADSLVRLTKLSNPDHRDVGAARTRSLRQLLWRRVPALCNLRYYLANASLGLCCCLLYLGHRRRNNDVSLEPLAQKPDWFESMAVLMKRRSTRMLQNPSMPAHQSPIALSLLCVLRT